MSDGPKDAIPLWALVIVLALCAFFAWGLFRAVAGRQAPTLPDPAVVKCPHCGKNVAVRVVKAEEEAK